MKAESYILRNQLTLDDLKDQIEATSFKLNLGQFAVEKDIYVTEIIHLISTLNHDHYRLVFQGGTCLAKAHKIIPRMSEDCDFRIEIKSSAPKLSKVKSRNKLRDFRLEIVDLLKKTGFIVEKDNTHVCNEGRFMNMKLQYESLYKQQSSLKPFMSLDFFFADIKTPTLELPVTTLIKNTLGGTVNYPEKMIVCMSIAETAAEKWVGLTRRIATTQHRQHYNDSSLVRHIYDLYKINQLGKLETSFMELVRQLIVAEITRFKTHNVVYAKEPIKEIESVLQILNSDEWQQNWDQLVNDMVFEQNPPSYKHALQDFNRLSKQCLEVIKQSKVS